MSEHIPHCILHTVRSDRPRSGESRKEAGHPWCIQFKIFNLPSWAFGSAARLFWANYLSHTRLINYTVKLQIKMISWQHRLADDTIRISTAPNPALATTMSPTKRTGHWLCTDYNIVKSLSCQMMCLLANIRACLHVLLFMSVGIKWHGLQWTTQTGSFNYTLPLIN